LGSYTDLTLSRCPLGFAIPEDCFQEGGLLNLSPLSYASPPLLAPILPPVSLSLLALLPNDVVNLNAGFRWGEVWFLFCFF